MNADQNRRPADTRRAASRGRNAGGQQGRVRSARAVPGPVHYQSSDPRVQQGVSHSAAPRRGAVRPVAPQRNARTSVQQRTLAIPSVSGGASSARVNASGVQTTGPRGKHAASPEEQAERLEAYKRANWQASEKKGLSRGKKVAIGVGCAVLALVLSGIAAALVYFGSINSQLQDGIDEEALSVLEAPVNADDPFYMLVLGSDTREEGATGRSDTIILARIDPSEKDVTLVSIPRDTQVQIEGYGTQKINAAYAFGGAAGAIKAVSDFAGVPIAHVVEVDFFGFKDIVDALGGVTVNVPPNTKYKGVEVPEGLQTLNGEQALVFARCRKTYAEGDYQRTKNQRQLIQAVAKEVLNAPATEIPSLVKSLASAVSTDMTVDELANLALSMRGMDVSSMKTAVVPSHSGMQDGVSYVFAEEPAWSEMMARVDAGEDPNADAADAGAEGAAE